MRYYRSNACHKETRSRSVPPRDFEGGKRARPLQFRADSLGHVAEASYRAGSKKGTGTVDKPPGAPGGQDRVTLLIGSTGNDGIALGADQKVMRGGEAYYSTKINIIENVAFATEGYTGLAEDFLLLLGQEVARKKGLRKPL